MQSQGFTINVSADVNEFLGRVEWWQKESVPFVTAYALTKTAQDIRDDEISVMARVFDRPTRYTLNALQVVPATKTTLRAEVLFKDMSGVPAWRYLSPEVEGGPRAKKGFERALERAGLLRPEEFCVPARGFPLDAQGNIPGSMIEQMLSALSASEGWAGHTSDITARSKKRNPQRGAYFILRGTKGAPDGIYKRQGKQAIMAMILFVTQPRYRKRFPFYETAKATFESNFAKHFRIGMATYGGKGKSG